MLGVTFGYKHSYDDWNLILTDRDISLPEPNRFTVEVPGANGKLDFTEAITPNITYKNRKISYTFKVKGGPTEWDEMIREIAGYLHGQKMQVVEDVDDDWMWDGFWTLDKFKSDRHVGTIAIKGDVYPYKLRIDETEKTITGNGTLNCTNDRMQVTPTITNTASATIVFNGKSVTLAAGTHKVADFVLEEGDNTFTITSTGTTKFQYREGAL